jgi:hypothetical protein
MFCVAQHKSLSNAEKNKIRAKRNGQAVARPKKTKQVVKKGRRAVKKAGRQAQTVVRPPVGTQAA